MPHSRSDLLLCILDRDGRPGCLIVILLRSAVLLEPITRDESRIGVESGLMKGANLNVPASSDSSRAKVL